MYRTRKYASPYFNQVVEEYYWNGNMVVFVNNKIIRISFEEAVKAIEEGIEREQELSKP